MFFVIERNQKKKKEISTLSLCLFLTLISLFVMDFFRTQKYYLSLRLNKCFVVYFTGDVMLCNRLPAYEQFVLLTILNN